MNGRIAACAGFLSIVLCLGCKGSGGGTSSQTSAQGICASSCLKDCKVDNDCDVTKGELCCTYPGLGNACQPAASCPRFCSADNTCDTTQACVRYSLDDSGGICAAPETGIKTCTADQNCKTGEKCCDIYSESICLPLNVCPVKCSDSSKCNTAQGEICCTTLNALDHTLTAEGLCVDPTVVTCPKLCQKSTDCRTQDGEVCCSGICSKGCMTKTCNVSNDCQGQICCKSRVANRSTAAPRGYPVPVHASGTGGAGGAGGTAGTGGAAGTGGVGGQGGGTGGSGGSGKSCSTWTTVAFADFNDGTLGGLSTCFGCSGGGCPYVVGQQLYMPSQWNLICYPGLSASETRAVRISYDVTDKGTMGGMGWDNFAVYLKTGTAGASCGDPSTHSVTFAVPAPSLVGHWDLIRWGGNSFQFNYNGTPLGEIDCALPALSGMAVDFHEGGPGLAQSLIDNFRVEVCTSSP